MVDWGVAALSVVACPGKFVDKYDAMQKGCILQACCLLETFVKSLQSRDYYVSRLLYDISLSSDVTYSGGNMYLTPLPIMRIGYL